MKPARGRALDAVRPIGNRPQVGNLPRNGFQECFLAASRHGSERKHSRLMPLRQIFDGAGR